MDSDLTSQFKAAFLTVYDRTNMTIKNKEDLLQGFCY